MPGKKIFAIVCLIDHCTATYYVSIYSYTMTVHPHLIRTTIVCMWSHSDVICVHVLSYVYTS